MLWLHHPIYGVAPPLSCVSSTYQITNFLDNHSLTCPFLLVGKMIENIKFKTTGPHPSDNWSTHHLSTAPQVLPWTSIRNPWHPFLARFGQSVGCWGVDFLSSWTTTSLARDLRWSSAVKIYYWHLYWLECPTGFVAGKQRKTKDYHVVLHDYPTFLSILFIH